MEEIHANVNSCYALIEETVFDYEPPEQTHWVGIVAGAV